MNEARVRRWTPLRIVGTIAVAGLAVFGALLIYEIFIFVGCMSSDSCLHI